MIKCFSYCECYKEEKKEKSQKVILYILTSWHYFTEPAAMIITNDFQ